MLQLQSANTIFRSKKFYHWTVYQCVARLKIACGCVATRKSLRTTGLGDFNGHVGKEIEGFEGIHGGYGMGERNAERRMQLELCDEKELCVANTWF